MMRRTILGMVLVAAALGGCGTSSSVGVHLEPGDVAWFDFRGPAPAVQIHNLGPGEVWVEAVAQGFSSGGLSPNAMRSVVLAGGGSVAVNNDSAEPADVEFTVEGASGIGMTKTKAQP